MPYKTEYEDGQWNVICSKCRGEFKARELVHDWRGFLVCERHRDPKPFSAYKIPPLPQDPEPLDPRDVQGPEIIKFTDDN